MLISNQTNLRPGGTLVFDGATATAIPTERSVGRFGETFSTSYANFDKYGNPQTITEQGNDSRTIRSTYYTDPSKWIIHQKKDETLTSGAETFVINRTFDANANMLSETRSGVPTRFTYTSEGDKASQTDALNRTTLYSGYFRGLPSSERQPEGINLTRTIDSAGNVTAQTDGELSTTSFRFDGINRVTGITHPVGNPVTVEWGKATRIVTRGPYREVTTYDGFGREIRVQHTDTANAETIAQNTQVDSLGRRVFASYPNASIGTKFSYDMLNRVSDVFNEYDPTNFTATSARAIDYFDYGVRFVNERNAVYFYTRRDYGDPEKGDLVSIKSPLDAQTASTLIKRNIAGQITSLVQDGVTRAYGYDANRFLTSITDPETGTTVMGRDAVGNMISRQVGQSQPSTYTYDNRNRLTAIGYPAGTPGVTRSYFNDNKLQSVDNGNARWDYLYDANKNLTAETLTIGTRVFPIAYSYDDNDARAIIQYGSGNAVTYAPDAFGRPRAAAPYINAVAYHPNGQPSSIAYANGVQTSIALDRRQRPFSLQIANSDPPLIDKAL